MIDLPTEVVVDEVKRASVDKSEVRESARSAETPLEKAFIYADAAAKQNQVGFRYKLDLFKAATEAFQRALTPDSGVAWTEWAMFTARIGGSLNDIEAVTSRALKAGADPELWQRWMVWITLHFQQPDCVRRVAPETQQAEELLTVSQLIWDGQYEEAVARLAQTSVLSAESRGLLQARILRLQGSPEEALDILAGRNDLEALLERGKAGDGAALEEAYRQAGMFPYVVVPYLWALAPKIEYRENVGTGSGRMDLLPSKYQHIHRAVSSASSKLLLARICSANNQREEAILRAEEVISEGQIGSQVVACHRLLQDWEKNPDGRAETRSVIGYLPDDALAEHEKRALNSV